MLPSQSSHNDRAFAYPGVRAAVLLCFFLSGATALIYEVVWTRMLILVFGATTFAISTVLTAFMAGLGLGGFAAGRWVDRRSRPVLIYGVLELCIGLYALAVPALFASLTPLYQLIWRHFAPQFYVFSIVRSLAVGSVLIVPTFMMGATLPVLSRFCARTRELIGTDVGTLYAINTLGAVLGTFGTGFLLIPFAGTRTTILIAAGLNIAIGLSAIVLGLSLPSRGEVDVPEETDLAEGDVEGRPMVVAAMVALGISGFAAMGYEVAWSRTLSLLIGSSVYAFTVMLTTFLLGLALGGMIGARLVSRLARRTPLAIAVTQILVAASALGVAHLFAELPYTFTVWFKRFGQHGHWRLIVLEFAMASAIMLVPTLLLGMMFPFTVRVCAPVVRRLGRSVGTVYAANTIGAILGSVCAGWLLIPTVGIMRTIVICATINVVAGVVVGWFAGGRLSQRLPLACVGLGLVCVAWVRVPSWPALVMSSGMYKYAGDLEDGPITKRRFSQFVADDYDLKFYREGITTTVTVAQHKETGNVWMATNGKIDASSGPDMPTQVLSGHLPLLLARDPKDVLVVGFASGVTVGATTTHPVRKIVAVEIEPAVIEGSEFFREVNRDPLADKERVELVLDDARNYLGVTDREFDVIISEPSNPWITGASSLFTQEYFTLGRSRLRPDGVFTQWLQLYGMATDDLRSLLATFCSVFPHVLIFETIETTDLLLVGSEQELKIDWEQVAMRQRRPAVAASLLTIEALDAARLLSYFLMGTREVRDLIGNAPLNTDDNGLIEFSSPKHLHADTQSRNERAIERALMTIQPYLANHGDTAESRAITLARIAKEYSVRELPERASRLAAVALGLSRSPEVLKIIPDLQSEVGGDRE